MSIMVGIKKAFAVIATSNLQDKPTVYDWILSEGKEMGFFKKINNQKQ